MTISMIRHRNIRMRRPRKTKKSTKSEPFSSPNTAVIESFLFLSDDDEKSKWRNEEEKTWRTTCIFTLFLFICSRIPLWSPSEYSFESFMTFSRENTLMTLGTQPFVIIGMISQFLLSNGDISRRQELLGGLFCSIVQSLTIGDGWIAKIQLVIASFVIMNCIDHVHTFGKMDVTTSLIVASGSMRIISSIISKSGFGLDAYNTSVLCVCMGTLLYLDQLYSPLLLTHKTKRINMNYRLNVMYNGTAPLILYYTLEEWLFNITGLSVPFLALFPSVFYITRAWPGMTQTTGYDVMRKLDSEGWTMQGWRSIKAMGARVETRVYNLTYYNSLILCGMAAITSLVLPFVSCGTLLIIVQAIKEHEPRDQLHEKLYPVRRLLRL